MARTDLGRLSLSSSVDAVCRWLVSTSLWCKAFCVEESIAEFALAKHILQLDEVLDAVEQELLPNRLCQYLFELSQKFNQFYEQCSVLKAEEPQRTSRLVLCDLTARSLQLGLSLLGIEVLERM